jgi:diguanylate cyclase (GGDEF)-like protein
MESKKQTVLIVDDMAANIEVLDNVLGDECEILFATNGEEALEIAADHLPDIILLDVVMPDMDGYEVCARLKANHKTQDIPIIFITAMNQEEEESKGLNAGGIDYITKPICPSVVKARVRNHLELKRHRDHLKELSSLDGLTGIANRRKFDEWLDYEWRRARRGQIPITLLMMDIDYFKSYNDHYGHLAGDDCLKRVAELLKETARRPADLPARYGGEEFALLLAETDAAGAVRVAERLQQRMKSANIPHDFSDVAPYVTLSIGVCAIVPSDSQLSHQLIESADKCLYAAKQNGRNRIEAAPELPVEDKSDF